LRRVDDEHINQSCAQQIMWKFQWIGKPRVREVPATGFDHERWHRQVNLEMEYFRQLARIMTRK
jgi:hypothetical protein